MKLDIARAWKDETYRRSLSEEQLNTLPANPAGELSDADLEAICGGWENSSYKTNHLSSTALVCELNVFTLNVNAVGVPINILTGPNSNCSQSH